MKEKTAASGMLLALYSILILSLLALTAAGARLYRQALRAQEEQSRQRGALSYIQSQAAACQGQGQIRLENGPEGVMLCLREPDTDYETRIYQYENALRTEFSRQDQPVTPENSEVVCALETLELGWENEKLLRIAADGRQAWVFYQGGGRHG